MQANRWDGYRVRTGSGCTGVGTATACSETRIGATMDHLCITIPRPVSRLEPVRESARHSSLNHERRQYIRGVFTDSATMGFGVGSFETSLTASMTVTGFWSSMSAFLPFTRDDIPTILRHTSGTISVMSSEGKPVTSIHNRNETRPGTGLTAA